jgi:polar amino acid transport system substrate-binding protein
MRSWIKTKFPHLSIGGGVFIAIFLVIGLFTIIMTMKIKTSKFIINPKTPASADPYQTEIALKETAEHGLSWELTTSMTSPLSKEDQAGFYDQVLLEVFRRVEQPIHITHLPTERSITNANLGITDGEFPRISGLDSIYHNLIKVPEKLDDFEFVAFTWRTDIQVTDWSSCKPYNVAIVRGWKILEANLADVKSLTRVKNQDILFALLADRRTDIVVYSRFEGQEMIRKLGLQSIRVIETPLAKREMFLYLNIKHQPMVPVIAEQLRNMKNDGTYNSILKKTLGPYMEGVKR